MAVAKKASKNAQARKSQNLLSRWGGKITMKSRFENGKMSHYAECESSGNISRRAKDLM